MKKLGILGAAALLALALPLAASAQINISATVVAACTFGSATVTLNGAAIAAGSAVTDTSSTVNLTCNKGATVTVALNNGANASGTQKRLRAGVDHELHHLQPVAAQCPGRWRPEHLPVAARNRVERRRTR